MAHDPFEQAEQSVTRYDIPYKRERIHVYELKLSNSEEVLRQCLHFMQQQARHEKKFILLFNAKHVKAQMSSINKLKATLVDYSELLFNPKLVKFAIMIKTFITHRKVIEMFDDIFDDAGVSRDKYNYFSMKDKEKIHQWFIEK